MNLEIKRRLDNELIYRGTSSPIFFIIIASAFLFYQFDVEKNKNFIIFFATIAVFSSLFRLLLTSQNSSKKQISKQVHVFFKFTVILNAIAFAGIFFFIFYEIGFESRYTSAGIALMVGLSAATMNSLSPNSFLQIFYNVITIIPSILLLAHNLSWQPANSPLFWLLNAQIIYALRQGRENKKYLTEKIKGDLYLEKTNEALYESRQELIEETAKSIHSSRLASLGEMASGIAHEVNNPLAIIQGSIEHLERTLPQDISTEKRVQTLSLKIQKSVNRIENIVKGLRSFSNQSDLNPMLPVSSRTIIQDTLDFCGEKFRINGIEITIEHFEECHIRCRPVQISQILINLLNNAYDAIELNKPEKKRITISSKKNNDYFLIKVSNSGPPMFSGIKDKIFQPFFTTKEIGKGTGLGLSISRNIAEHHHGELFYIEGLPETTFCLKLPIYIEERTETSP